jgi:diaminopimelate decarboxylase
MLDALAADLGTPLFVYDEDDLRRRCREYAGLFGAGSVAYAGKAFLCVAMARLVAEEGLHLDVATGGELHVALHAGFPPERIVFHGNNKSTPELTAALDAGVGRIVADSFDELDRLERLATERSARPSVLVRVTPGVEAHTHEFIETGTLDSKFGFTTHDDVALEAARRVIESPVLRLGGLHCHIGSMIERLDAYARAVAIVIDLCAAIEESTGARVEELNMGGGLASRYLATDPEVSLAEYESTLRTTVKQCVADAGIGEVPRLMVEPGRSIAAPAAITVYRVGTVKRIPHGRTYVAVDGGMSDNPSHRRAPPARVLDRGQALRTGRPRGGGRPSSRRCPCRRPARSTRDRRVRLLDGVQLQQGAPAGGGVRARRAGSGRRPARDARRSHAPRCALSARLA